MDSSIIRLTPKLSQDSLLAARLTVSTQIRCFIEDYARHVCYSIWSKKHLSLCFQKDPQYIHMFDPKIILVAISHFWCDAEL